MAFWSSLTSAVSSAVSSVTSKFSWNLSNTFSNLYRAVMGCPKDDFLCKMTGGRVDLPAFLLKRAQNLHSWSGIPPYVSIPVAGAFVAGCAYMAYRRLSHKETLEYIKAQIKKRFGEDLYKIIIGPLLSAIEDAINDAAKPTPAKPDTPVTPGTPAKPTESEAEKKKRKDEARKKILDELRKNFDSIMKANRDEIKRLLEERKAKRPNTTRAKGATPSTSTEGNTEIDLKNYFYRMFFLQPRVAKALKAH